MKILQTLEVEMQNSPVEGLSYIAQSLFDDIRALSEGEIGITRASYGEGESRLATFLSEFAQANGLEVKTDRAANLHFSLPKNKSNKSSNSNTASIWCGSHLDSVPQGGNYDGLAGIIAGLLCLIAQKESSQISFYSLNVVALRGEESAWFGKAYLGSSALFGKLNAQDLDLTQAHTGLSLKECMQATGADIDAILNQECLIDLSQIHAYLELHIEQGPVMIKKNIPVAVVSGLRGNVRHSRIRCYGVAGHSGVVPKELRHDVVFAVANLIMKIDKYWQELLNQGADLVVTIGIITTDVNEHAITKIPDKLSFSCDIRSQDDATLNLFHQFIKNECATIANESVVNGLLPMTGIRFEFDRAIKTAPALMSPDVIEHLLKCCTKQGLAAQLMPSGAGHDAALFAGAGIPTGMLFIRNQNGSHNPDETLEMDDFMQGVAVLYAALINFY
ncbi:allantoate amidohydrolase [Gammaproteobacteria bacterium]|nr:allantoate amidohydrolase [Gammaproteobacteria bacterium]